MSRFNRFVAPPVVAPITTTGHTAIGHQGGVGHARTPQSELFLLCVNYLEGGRFYGDQDKRFKDLARLGAVADPKWMFDMLRWLRKEANLRTAPLMGAAQFVSARLDAKMPPLYVKPDGTLTEENPDRTLKGVDRTLIGDVLLRPDEPGEMIGYWVSNFGRSIPKPVKRGVADAAERGFTEKSFLKYDSDKAAYRFADVLDLTHPKGSRVGRDELFHHVLDARHNRDDLSYERLPVLAARKDLFEVPQENRLNVLHTPQAADLMARAGMTWEALSSWLGRSLTSRAWEVMLPSMGLMAVVRNARNMDNATVDTKALMPTFMRMMDPEEIRRSRMLPFRFLSAYRHSNLRWHGALDAALTLSLGNVPALSGRSLILVDRSGSMDGSMSDRSELTYADTASLFGAALALRAQNADLVQFGSGSAQVPFASNESPLQVLSRFTGMGGTYTSQAVQKWYKGHDRVIILTDEQVAYDGNPGDYVPKNIPMFTWNLAGYRYGHAPSGSDNRFTSGGLSDQSFSLIPMLEGVHKGQWPWIK